MATDKKISELPVATALTGPELFELVQGGVNKQGTPDMLQTFIGPGITREFNRAFSSELLFDKNEIDYTPHTLTGNTTFSVSASEDNLVNQFSGAVHTVTVDGSQAISFSGFQFIYGITNGESPEAGTYQVFFMYRNGVASVHWAYPSLQTGAAIQLPAPANLQLVAGTDPETEIDATWDAVSGAINYEIEYSATGGGGPWLSLQTLGVLLHTYSGLTADSTYHVRVRALGNGTSTLNSNYSIAAITTSDAGDVTAPTFIFDPVDTGTDIGVSYPIMIIANEALQNADGSPITSNQAGIIVLKETNGAGADIPHSWTIDVTKTVITITPTAGYGGNQLVFVEIDNVEDVSGNESAADSITFTTSGYTAFNGTTNHLRFGDVLESLWSAPDVVFKLRATIKNYPLDKEMCLLNKYSGTDNQRSWNWVIASGGHVQLVTCRVGTAAARVIRWSGVLNGNEAEMEIRYDGSIDTNDGLDRADLYIGGVLQGSKSMVAVAGVLPANIFNSSAQLAFGVGVAFTNAITYPAYFEGEAKDVEVLSVGDVVQLDVPVLIEGSDLSSNNLDGTWVS